MTAIFSAIIRAFSFVFGLRCPSCGHRALESEGETIHGTSVWHCKHCNSLFI